MRRVRLWADAVLPRRQRSLPLVALAIGCLAAGAQPIAPPPVPLASVAVGDAAPEPLELQPMAPALETARAPTTLNSTLPHANDPFEVEPAPTTIRRTPMSGEAAAHYLADAWHAEEQEPIGIETLAVLWAHWALETGRGESMVSYNFAGLKGRAPRGGSHRLWTREKNDSVIEWVQRRFRAYETAEAGARDYLRLLKRKFPRALRAARRGSPVDFVHALDQGGYFSDEAEAYLKAVVSLNREFLQDSGARSGSPGARAAY